MNAPISVACPRRQVLLPLLLCLGSALPLSACKKKKYRAATSPSQTPLTMGYLATPLGLSQVYYQAPRNGGDVLIEGDMAYPPSALSATNPQQGLRAVAVSNIAALWPNGRIPYELAVTDEEIKAIGETDLHDFLQRLGGAMRLWEADGQGVATGWKFEPARADEHNVVVIGVEATAQDGYANVGRAGGRQNLRFGRGEVDAGPVMLHRLGHVLGLHHEHTHPDAKKFIRVNWENIIEAYKGAFATVPLAAGQVLGPYDKWSVMHFGPTKFSIGNLNCDTRSCAEAYPSLSGINGHEISENYGISAGDYETVRKLRSLADQTFVNPASLEAKAPPPVEATTKPKAPPFLSLSKDKKVVFHSLTVQQGSEGAGEALERLVYHDKFFLGALTTGTYRLSVRACTLPEISLNPGEACGPRQELAYTRFVPVSKAEADFEVAYSNAALQANDTFGQILVSISQFQYEMAACPAVNRGAPQTFLAEQLSQHQLALSADLQAALLSDYRFTGSVQAPTSARLGSSGKLNLAGGGAAARTLAQALEEGPNRAEAASPTRVDPGVPLYRFDGALVSPRGRALEPSPDVGIPALERAQAQPVVAPSFWQKYRRTLFLGGGIVAVAVGLGVTIGLFHDKLPFWESGGGGDAPPASSPEPYVYTECSEVATAQAKFAERLSELVSQLRRLESTMQALQAAP